MYRQSQTYNNRTTITLPTLFPNFPKEKSRHQNEKNQRAESQLKRLIANGDSVRIFQLANQEPSLTPIHKLENVNLAGKRRRSDISNNLSLYLLRNCQQNHVSLTSSSAQNLSSERSLDNKKSHGNKEAASPDPSWTLSHHWRRQATFQIHNSLLIDGIEPDKDESLAQENKLEPDSNNPKTKVRKPVNVKKVRLYTRDEIAEERPAKEVTFVLPEPSRTKTLSSFQPNKKAILETLPMASKSQVSANSENPSDACLRRQCGCCIGRRSSLPPEAFVPNRRGSRSKSFVREKTSIQPSISSLDRSKSYSLQLALSRPLKRSNTMMDIQKPMEIKAPVIQESSPNNLDEEPEMVGLLSDSETDSTIDALSISSLNDMDENIVLTPIRETISRAASSRNGRNTRLRAKTPNPFKGALPNADFLTNSLRRQFTELDTDADGHIHFNQLRNILHSKGLTHPERKYLKIMYDLTSATTFFGVEEFGLLLELSERILDSSHILREAFQRMSDVDLHETTYRFVEKFQGVASTSPDNQSQVLSEADLKNILIDLLNLKEDDINGTWMKIQMDLQLACDSNMSKLDYLTTIPYFVSLQPSLQTQFVAQRARTLLQI